MSAKRYVCAKFEIPGPFLPSFQPVDSPETLYTYIQEVQLLRDQQMRMLEDRLRGKEEECTRMFAQLNKLRQDFEYNLALIDERDAELKQLEAQASCIVRHYHPNDSPFTNTSQTN